MLISTSRTVNRAGLGIDSVPKNTLFWIEVWSKTRYYCTLTHEQLKTHVSFKIRGIRRCVLTIHEIIACNSSFKLKLFVTTRRLLADNAQTNDKNHVIKKHLPDVQSNAGLKIDNLFNKMKIGSHRQLYTNAGNS